MASGAQAHRQEQPSRRRQARYRVRAPLDVTVLRSGIPDTLPGRSVDLSEGGMAAILAGELAPGESVGVELWLSPVSDPLRARAVVRHHDRLLLGLEFEGLSLEQQSAIRNWTTDTKPETENAIRSSVAVAEEKSFETVGSDSGGPKVPARRGLLKSILAVLAAVMILAGLWWWRWNREWEELESGLQNSKNTVEVHPQAHVPADVMEKLVTHRVDPDYPAAARPEKLQGVIALDVVVGRDGSVVEVRPLNGPDILAQAAVAALRWWRFEPYRVDGQPVVAETTVAVEFKP